MNTSRRSGLDGLRGVAALIVVAHHLLLTLPWFADRVFIGLLGQKNSFTFSIFNIFEYTPLHIFYGGSEAVIIFFVLSGYLLVFSVNKTEIFSYARYRLVRLYLPIFTVTLLCCTLFLLFPRKSLAGGSQWVNSHSMEVTLASCLKNFWVVDGTDWLNSALWTMKYEIIFSLAVVVVAGFTFKQSVYTFLFVVTGLSSLIWVGINYGFDLLSWLPVFFAGSAIHWLPENRFRFSFLQLILGVFVLYLPWSYAGFGYSSGPATGRILMTLGALIIVDVSRQAGNSVSSLLSMRIPALAGRYSYSLYLVHSPVIITVWFVMGVPADYADWLVQVLVSLVCIAIVTTLVYQVAEKPSLKWIKRQKNCFV